MSIKNIKIEKLDDFGRGISYFNNKIIFIFDALVDEVVDIEITKETKKYYEAVVTKYIVISPKRIKPICPYFNKCGGCDLMHINYQEQLSFKQNKVNEVINKKCSLNKVVKDIIFGEGTNYRNKVTLKVKNKKIGFYKKDSNNLIEIDYCYLLDNKINTLIKIIKENIDLTDITDIVIRVSKEDQMIVFYGLNIDEQEISKIKDYVSSIYLYDTKYKLIYGKSKIIEKLNNLKLSISPNSFLQVNTKTCLKMYDKIASLINDNPHLLDLYCGVGSIGLYVSNKCTSLVGVEINKNAVRDAKENKKLNKIANITFYDGKASEVLKRLKERFDYIIVDPPRNGLDKKTIDLIKANHPNNLIYVSCDVMTLSRDINLLQAMYEVKEITPVDMFPQTYHVECITKLHIKSN